MDMATSNPWWSTNTKICSNAIDSNTDFSDSFVSMPNTLEQAQLELLDFDKNDRAQCLLNNEEQEDLWNYAADSWTV